MTLGTRQKGLASWKLTTFAICVLACVSSQAERLPIKTYTTADGLAQNAVNQIVRDSRGFLWFCTNEGLSRFDGYTFTKIRQMTDSLTRWSDPSWRLAAASIGSAPI